MLQVLPRVAPPVINKTNAVFVSQTHLLMSSTWFIDYRTPPPSAFNHVMDFHRDWRNVEEIIFLRFCKYPDDSRGVLAIIVVNKSSAPFQFYAFRKVND
ncbi:hypothetical protein L5515_017369 [Caenorhabditis briggsae]|uniref:Uncharacterized protein n=1 Tax=Caenorhabditis briggsae TaxID=6238 RepID=A0AAE9FDK7_CAEBR|nr:hypothetical protein L5515_017369 [Caenorhabditis briggsae]